jgi:hypothetical protein
MKKAEALNALKTAERERKRVHALVIEKSKSTRGRRSVVTHLGVLESVAGRSVVVLLDADLALTFKAPGNWDPIQVSELADPNVVEAVAYNTYRHHRTTASPRGLTSKPNDKLTRSEFGLTRVFIVKIGEPDEVLEREEA